MSATRGPLEIPSINELTTISALQADFMRSALLPQDCRTLLGCVVATVPVAFWILPSTFGGIQIALAVYGTVVTLLVLLVIVRDERRAFHQLSSDLLRAFHEAQVEAQHARESAEEARAETARARSDLEQIALQGTPGAKFSIRGERNQTRDPRQVSRTRSRSARREPKAPTDK